ncbi:MAG: hypothetical protein ABI432_03085 [Flavobacteriales bacterium]
MRQFEVDGQIERLWAAPEFIVTHDGQFEVVVDQFQGNFIASITYPFADPLAFDPTKRIQFEGYDKGSLNASFLGPVRVGSAPHDIHRELAQVHIRAIQILSATRTAECHDQCDVYHSDNRVENTLHSRIGAFLSSLQALELIERLQTGVALPKRLACG